MMRDRTTRTAWLLAAALVLMIGSTPAGAEFNSGSSEANGALPAGPLPEGTTEMILDLRNGELTFQPGGESALLPNTPGGGFSDGIVQLTTLDVPAGVVLRFVRNVGSTAVQLLLQGNGNVAGTIDVSGENGGPGGFGRGGFGGPGGFKGGNGKTIPSTLGAGAGLGPGAGKGGGSTATNTNGAGGGGYGTPGAAGTSNAGSGGPTYGTTTLLPLIGGSGGGGGPLSNTSNPVGGGGGGGGGALLIASSATLTVTGVIIADGGAGGLQGAGGGSGGAIRLIADTLAGDGTISAVGGTRGGSVGGIAAFGGAGGLGRIRLEADLFEFIGTIAGHATSSAPGFVLLPNPPTVTITFVDGVAAPATPTGIVGGVDVIIDSPGTKTIDLTAVRVPLGSTIRVTAKIEQDGALIGPIDSTALTGSFESSGATVDLTFPTSGLYFIEARATFTLP